VWQELITASLIAVHDIVFIAYSSEWHQLSLSHIAVNGIALMGVPSSG